MHLVILGLVLVVGGVQFAHFTGLTEYIYSVEPTTQAAATNAAEQASNDDTTVIYEFAELPSSAQDAFLSAYESSNHKVTIRGRENRVTGLYHITDVTARPGDGIYYVTYQGSYYKFTPRNPMSMNAPVVLSGYALAVGGTIIGTYGGFKHRSRSRALLAFGSGVVTFITVYGLTGWWALNDFLTLLAVGALCAALPAIGMWSLYSALRS